MTLRGGTTPWGATPLPRIAMLLLAAGVVGLVVDSYVVWRDEHGRAASPPT